MTLRHRAVALVTAVSILSLSHAASAQNAPRTKIAQTKKNDRSRPPPPPPPPPPPATTASAPATAPAAPIPPSAPPSYTPVAPIADPSSAPLPPPVVVTTSAPIDVTGNRALRPYPSEEEDRGTKEGSPNWTLFGVGTGLLVSTWIATGAVTAAICDGKCKNGETGVAWVPIAGPMLVGAMGKPSGGQIAALTASFITQTGAATMMILGLALKTPEKRSPRSLYVAPQLGSNGMVMGGTF